MKFIRGLHNIRPENHGCVLSIGNFDGVHRGHQALLARLKHEGQKRHLPTMVMIFEPQPLEFFSPEKSPPRLTYLRDKLKYLSQIKIDYVLCVKFDPSFAAYTADDFIAEFLIKQLGVHLLVVGDDFRFGKKRQGNIKLLTQASKKIDFQIISIEGFFYKRLRISSTVIREALQKDQLALAEDLLGHPYCISGRIVHGDKLGRTLGFPTLNLPVKSSRMPVQGVYVVEVYGLTYEVLPGVANIGSRPTISGTCHQIDVHVLDFSMEVYGRYVDIVFRQKLRNEQRFTSLDALRQQISLDVLAARTFFGLKLKPKI